jgi:hypothetical protein
LVRSIYRANRNTDKRQYLEEFLDNFEILKMEVRLCADLKLISIKHLSEINQNAVGTDDVYNTTFHECGHASHWSKVGSSYWVKYINYIITYGSRDNPYGKGTGNNAGYCGVGEMWGNYIGAMFERQEFSRTNWNDLNHGEGWYNPGFLRHVDDIPDVTTSEIFSCMTSSTNTIAKMVEQLKTKTENDEDIDNAYNLYTDWP